MNTYTIHFDSPYMTGPLVIEAEYLNQQDDWTFIEFTAGDQVVAFVKADLVIAVEKRVAS